MGASAHDRRDALFFSVISRVGRPLHKCMARASCKRFILHPPQSPVRPSQGTGRREWQQEARQPCKRKRTQPRRIALASLS